LLLLFEEGVWLLSGQLDNQVVLSIVYFPVQEVARFERRLLQIELEQVYG